MGSGHRPVERARRTDCRRLHRLPLRLLRRQETVIDSIITGSVGRSLRSTAVVAIASTTFCESGSTASPKIVCLRVRWGVLPTVMKNCEPLLPGPALAIASRYGFSELRFCGG